MIFAADADLAAYASWLAEAANKYDVKVHAWVFMTNHVHLLMTPPADTAISQCIQHLGRNYVRYFNYKHHRTGTLFEGRYKSCPVDSRRYLLACSRYIELNPVRAGVVEDPADYAWSSYCSNAFNQTVKLWSPHAEYLALGRCTKSRTENYRELFQTEITAQTLKDIREALNTGLVLGTDTFKVQVEALTGQPQSPQKRGPKNKSHNTFEN